MKQTLYILVAVLLAGCQPLDVRPLLPGRVSNDLMAWVDQGLAPELVGRLTATPRFRDQPLLIVKLDGERLSPTMDALSERIRTRLRDRLLRNEGIRVAWQPPARLIDAERRSAGGDCRGLADMAYLLGIDVQLHESGDLQVSVRVLDPREQRWVSGFAWNWRGRPTGQQRAELARGGPDESLRGLRELPFEANETDRLARYLADRLDCRLRRGGVGEVAVWVAPGEEGLSELLRNYLTQGGAVRIAEQPQAAGIRLRVQRHAVDEDLQQLWVVATAQGDQSPAPWTLSAYQRPVVAGKPRTQPPATTIVPDAFESLHFTARRSCRHCRDLQVRLSREAWLFVLRLEADDQAELVFPQSCSGGIEDPQAAGLSLRLRAGYESGMGDGGRYYVIAITEAAVAGRMAELVGELPGACGRRRLLGPRQMERWLAALTRLEIENREGIAWRRLPESNELASEGGWPR